MIICNIICGLKYPCYIRLNTIYFGIKKIACFKKFIFNTSIAMNPSQAKKNRKIRADILAKKRALRKGTSKISERKKKYAIKVARKKSLELKKKAKRDARKLSSELKKKARKIARMRSIEMKKDARKQLKKDEQRKKMELKKAANLKQKQINKDLAKKKRQIETEKRRLERKNAKEIIAKLKKEDQSKKRRSKIRRAELRKNKPVKSKFDCSPENAVKVQRHMMSLVPTPNQIEHMTQKRYTKLRSEMSTSLTAVKTFSSNCNKSYGKEKASLKKKSKSKSRGLMIPVRDIFIPDIGVNVSNECPISEGQFARARARLENKKSKSKTNFPVKRKKKRIAPMLVQ